MTAASLFDNPRYDELAGALTTTGYTSWEDQDGREVIGLDVHEAYCDLAAEFVALVEEHRGT